MISLQLLGTAWTVWNLARRRVGPVAALLVTAVVIGGLVYLRPRLAERFPALAEAILNVGRGEDAEGGGDPYVEGGEDVDAQGGEVPASD